MSWEETKERETEVDEEVAASSDDESGGWREDDSELRGKEGKGGRSAISMKTRMLSSLTTPACPEHQGARRSEPRLFLQYVSKSRKKDEERRDEREGRESAAVLGLPFPTSSSLQTQTIQRAKARLTRTRQTSDPLMMCRFRSCES